MKFNFKKNGKDIEIDVKYCQLEVFAHEIDLPDNCFGYSKSNDYLTLEIDIETGQITDCPIDFSANIYLKVCDGGCYYLLDKNYNVLSSILEDYVPNKLLPGGYGDFLDLQIENGVVTNLLQHPSIEDFSH